MHVPLNLVSRCTHSLHADLPPSLNIFVLAPFLTSSKTHVSISTMHLLSLATEILFQILCIEIFCMEDIYTIILTYRRLDQIAISILYSTIYTFPLHDSANPGKSTADYFKRLS